MLPRLCRAGAAGIFWLVAATAAMAVPRINEIMFRPAGMPENTAHEFVEIYNPDPQPYDLTGSSFDRGVRFTFPAVTIPAGGYLVVAAQVNAFRAQYPSVPASQVVGGWTGTLSNSEETIRLVDASGATLDAVHYATQGDWAQRVRETVHNGWDWRSPADGGGPSLELVNIVLGNNNGQNWAPSAAAGGTPGRANSVASNNVAPLIKNVRHRPIVPRSSDPVEIRCQIEDEDPENDSATLFWRVSSPNPPPFTQLAMSLDDDRWVATIPPQPNGTIVEFYVRASDGTLSRTWPAPTSEGQNANALYQVDDEVITGDTSWIRLVLSVPENTAYQGLSQGSDRQFNATVIADFGSGLESRYLASMRVRGASSRAHNPRPMRVEIPNDRPLDGWKTFNLNPKYTYLQYVGMKLFQAGGLRAPDAKPVLVRRNGVNHARNDEFDYGRWVMVEHLDGDFVDRHWPEDSGGNLYKKVRPDNDWAFRNGNVQAYLGDGWSKENNRSANDWTDLDRLLRVFSAPSGADWIFDVQQIADFDQWMRWFAMANLIAHGETNISNGADDDYSMYRGAVSGKFEFIPHDLDTILSLGDGSRISDPRHTLFDHTERGDVLDKLVPFFGTSSGGGLPVVRTAYFRAIQQYAATVLAPEFLDPFLQNHLGGWVPQAQIDQMKSFMAQRTSFALQQAQAALGTPYVPSTPTAVSTLTAPRTASVVISEVLARNVGAHQVDGLFPDYIELRNYSSTAINISGTSLTDDPAVKLKHVFPAGTIIPAGGYLVVLAETPPPGATGTYTNFSLDGDGDAVYFHDPSGVLIDSVLFGPQVADRSIGRTGPAGDVWALGLPSPGSANSAVTVAGPAALKINEWLSNPDVRTDADFVEVYNPQSQVAAMGGLFISDDFINYPSRHVLPALSFVAPQGFALFKALGGSAEPTSPSELPFKLSARSGWISLAGSNAARIDVVDYECQRRDASQGRRPDGSTTIQRLPLPTPGLPNTDAPASMLALLNGLRITELNYHPRDGNDYEFIELRNVGNVALNLGGVRFTEGVRFTFPEMTLAPNQYTVIVRDRARFESRYGTNRPVAGVFSGAIDNNGETLALTLPSPWDLHILRFRYEATWYPTTAGQGYTLEILDPARTAPRDWNERDSWQAGTFLHGTPGTSSPPAITSALTANGTVGSPFTYTITAANDPSSFGASNLPPGLSFTPSSGMIAGTPTQAGRFNATISATNLSGTDSQTLVIDIVPQPPPAITSPLNASGLVGALFTYRITATNNPTSYSATNLPGWMTVNTSTGVLSGTPSAAGVFNVNLQATNGAGTDSKVLIVQIVADDIAAAVDSPVFLFTKGGEANWFAQTQKTHDGIDAARSGAISHSQSSWVETRVTGPAKVTFWWSVSSELNFDFLRVRLDGTVVHEISGDKAWEQKEVTIPAGQHTLRWSYEKDNSISSGDDAGWLDEVVLVDPDVDQDGLSDHWENAFFGNLNQGAADDPDGDGISNLHEFLSGTSPVDARSALRMRSAQVRPGGQHFLEWDSVAGRIYQVQASPDLRVWIDVGPQVLGSDGTTSTVVSVPSSSISDVTLVPEVTAVRALIPEGPNVGTLWRGGDEAAFAAAGGDAAWLSGTTGVGFETQPQSATTYTPFIGTDVVAASRTQASVYSRIRFNVTSPAALSELVLGIRYDDGFVAWINGQRVASANAPTPLAWNSAATADNPDPQALLFEAFPLTGPYSYLRAGENILAVQIMNGDLNSSDLLMQPKLTGKAAVSFPSDRVFWRVRVRR